MNDTTSNSTTLETFESETSFAPQKILGWHFSSDTILNYRDNRPIIIGETLSVEGEIIPCVFGLHASEKALNAFRYVRGKYLWRVELEGDLKSHANSNGIVDKWVGRKRKVLAGGNATVMLLKFARKCALDVLHLLPNAPEEVKIFLETGIKTKLLRNYFGDINNDYAYNAACNVYKAYGLSDYSIGYSYNSIFFAAKALNVPFQIYTDEFEEACLKFINERENNVT